MIVDKNSHFVTMSLELNNLEKKTCIMYLALLCLAAAADSLLATYKGGAWLADAEVHAH